MQCSGIRACLGLQIKFVGIVGSGCWAPWRMKPVPTITTLHVHPSFDLLSLPMLATQRRHFSILCQQTILLFQVGCERHQYKSMQCSSQPCTFLLYYGTVHDFFFLFDVKSLKREGMPNTLAPMEPYLGSVHHVQNLYAFQIVLVFSLVSVMFLIFLCVIRLIFNVLDINHLNF